MCIYIVEIWFGIANGQISSVFDRVICPWHDNGGVLLFHIFIYGLWTRYSVFTANGLINTDLFIYLSSNMSQSNSFILK